MSRVPVKGGGGLREESDGVRMIPHFEDKNIAKSCEFVRILVVLQRLVQVFIVVDCQWPIFEPNVNFGDAIHALSVHKRLQAQVNFVTPRALPKHMEQHWIVHASIR